MPHAVPSIIIRPAPESDPPYDDVTTAMSSWRDDWLVGGRKSEHGVQGELPLSFRLPSGLPAAPDVTTWRQPGLRAGGPVAGVAGVAGVADDRASTNTAATRTANNSPSAAGTRELPPARPWACRFTQALVEVLSGTRPPIQLTRWTSEAVYDDIGRRVACLRDTPRARRLTVRSIRLSLPREDATEVSAVVRAGERSRAIALRLEGHRGRWLCTELEIG